MYVLKGKILVYKQKKKIEKKFLFDIDWSFFFYSIPHRKRKKKNLCDDRLEIKTL